MKRLATILFVAAFLASCCNGLHYKIEGELTGIEGDVSLVFDDTVVATEKVKDGKIRFSGRVDEPKIAFLQKANGEAFSMLFIEKGDIHISDQGIVGTPANDAYQNFLTRQSELVKQFYAEDATDQERDSIIQADFALQASVLSENPDNLLGVYFIVTDQMNNLDPEKLEENMSKLSVEMQNHSYLSEMKAYLNSFKRVAVGQPFIDIKLPDVDGKELALSDLAGKGNYILVDFWASWCGPCRQELPYLFDVYTKYHKKGFDIYAVSLDESKQDWLQAVDQQNMFWNNVRDAASWQAQCAQDYAIKSIPQNVLIAPDGTIAAKNLRGKELQEKLAEIYE